MAKREATGPVTLSVLDRMIDNDPKSSSEMPPTRPQSLRDLKLGFKRDMEWLLNTRRVFQEPDESLKEVNRSLYIYGLPDFSTYAMASPTDRAKLFRQLVAAIKMFEPRLVNARVIPVEAEGGGIQELRFRIEGMLSMDPAPEPVSFDTVIELRSSAARLTRGLNA